MHRIEGRRVGSTGLGRGVGMHRFRGRRLGVHRIRREEGGGAQDGGKGWGMHRIRGRRVGMPRSGGQKFSTVPQIKEFPRLTTFYENEQQAFCAEKNFISSHSFPDLCFFDLEITSQKNL